jgi:hypothetical protein
MSGGGSLDKMYGAAADQEKNNESQLHEMLNSLRIDLANQKDTACVRAAEWLERHQQQQVRSAARNSEQEANEDENPQEPCGRDDHATATAETECTSSHESAPIHGEQVDALDENAIMQSIGMVISKLSEQCTQKEDERHAISDEFACSSNTNATVSDREAFYFIDNAYNIAEWSWECNVIALVLIARVQHSIAMTPKNWNHLLLVALMVAHKMWDDIPLTSQDFPEVWARCVPDAAELSVKQLTRMEARFLVLIEWDTHVTRKIFDEFIAELSDLFEK